jgi:hypothetical protein
MPDPTRGAAWTLLCEWTKTQPLRRHALSVEASMRALARRAGAAGDGVASRLESPAVGEVLMRVGDWAFFRPSAHPSWCPIGDVKVETRAYVLLGSCR